MKVFDVESFKFEKIKNAEKIFHFYFVGNIYLDGELLERVKPFSNCSLDTLSVLFNEMQHLSSTVSWLLIYDFEQLQDVV